MCCIHTRIYTIIISSKQQLTSYSWFSSNESCSNLISIRTKFQRRTNFPENYCLREPLFHQELWSGDPKFSGPKFQWCNNDELQLHTDQVSRVQWGEYSGKPSACTQPILLILYTKPRMKTVEAHGTKIPSFLGSLHMHNARKFHIARPKFGLATWDYEAYPCELYFTLDCGSRCCCQVHAWSRLPVTMIMNLAHKNARPSWNHMYKGGHYSLEGAIFPGPQTLFTGDCRIMTIWY